MLRLVIWSTATILLSYIAYVLDEIMIGIYYPEPAFYSNGLTYSEKLAREAYISLSFVLPITVILSLLAMSIAYHRGHKKHLWLPVLVPLLWPIVIIVLFMIS
jgi:hypothetical protein